MYIIYATFVGEVKVYLANSCEDAQRITKELRELGWRTEYNEADLYKIADGFYAGTSFR